MIFSLNIATTRLNITIIYEKVLIPYSTVAKPSLYIALDKKNTGRRYCRASLKNYCERFTMLYMNTHKEITDEVFEQLLYLSRLSPASSDIATLKKQVAQIVSYFEILSKYDDSENPYDAYPATVAEELRSDKIVEGLPISDTKHISENFMDGYFQVPKVLGEGA